MRSVSATCAVTGERRLRTRRRSRLQGSCRRATGARPDHSRRRRFVRRRASASQPTRRRTSSSVACQGRSSAYANAAITTAIGSPLCRARVIASPATSWRRSIWSVDSSSRAIAAERLGAQGRFGVAERGEGLFGERDALVGSSGPVHECRRSRSPKRHERARPRHAARRGAVRGLEVRVGAGRESSASQAGVADAEPELGEGVVVVGCEQLDGLARSSEELGGLGVGEASQGLLRGSRGVVDRGRDAGDCGGFEEVMRERAELVVEAAGAEGLDRAGRPARGRRPAGSSRAPRRGSGGSTRARS